MGFPVVPEVSGTVTEVAVASNQRVSEGDLLLSIDSERYELGVKTAESNLQTARQATGASTANVDAARAQVEAARASMLRAQQDARRLRNIKQEDPGAISDRRLESAEATAQMSRAQLDAAEAGLERAMQDLGNEGDDNTRIQQAYIALEQAQIDLQNTKVYAPSDGIVTDVRVATGNFAKAGAAQMTFVATHDLWVQADFTENNLGNIEAGDKVGIIFDALPGEVYEGSVRTIGVGVKVDSAPLGSLPTINNDRDWLRDAQRFAVRIDFDVPDTADRSELRVGGQATVIVYTGGNFLFNGWGRFRMWVASYLSYAY